MTSSSVLYVENQPFFADIELLKLEGIVYELAETAAQARDKLAEKPYAAVLLDIMMDPGEDSLAPTDIPAYMGGGNGTANDPG